MPGRGVFPCPARGGKPLPAGAVTGRPFRDAAHERGPGAGERALPCLSKEAPSPRGPLPAACLASSGGRPAALAGRVALAQGEVEEFLGAGHGHLQGQAVAETGGDGRRQGAAGAVVVGGLHLGLGQEFGRLSGLAEAVRDHDGAFHMPALDEHGLGAHPDERLTGGSGVIGAADGHAGEHLGFGAVGGQQVAAGDHAFPEGFHGILTQQAAAALAHGNRVHHQREAAVAQGVGQGVDDAGREEHAGLGGVHGKTVQHGAQLQHDEFGPGRVDAGDAQAVLGGQGRDDAHAVAAQGHDGLEVGLDAGTAAGVGTGDGQDVGGAHGYLLFCDGGPAAVGTGGRTAGLYAASGSGAMLAARARRRAGARKKGREDPCPCA